jgi:hypothetical protein
MSKPSDFKEKRNKSRVLVNLSVNLRMLGEPNHKPGVINNASEAGLLVNTLYDMPLGKKVIIEVLFAERGKSSNFKVLTQIVWKDIGLWDDWEGYLYGLKLIQILEEDYPKLKRILYNQFKVEEVRFVNQSDEKERLPIDAKL